MRCCGRLLFVAVLTALYACSGGGSTTTPAAIPSANTIVGAPAGNARGVQLGLQPVSAILPVVSDITGTLLFPAVRTSTSISLSASTTAPAGVALDSVRRARSGSLTVYEYITCVSPIPVSLPSLPAITLHFPASTPLVGKSVYYGISDLDAQGGLVSYNTYGPGTLDGRTVSFAQVPTPIAFEANHQYTFVVYATGTASASAGASKIYVVNKGSSPNSGTLTTYNADGTRTTPTIAGLNPSGVAVDAAGKIYVSDFGYFDGTFYTNPSLRTYKPNGTQTSPTITGGRNFSPCGVAVDGAGKIYLNVDANSVLFNQFISMMTIRPHLW